MNRRLLESFFERSGNINIQLPDYGSLIERYRSKSKLKSSRYFYNLIPGDRKSFLQRDTRKPVIGYFCNAVPEEIIWAFNAIPVRLCNTDSICAQAGEEIVPGDICPIIKSICGAVYNKEYEGIDLLVVPATCDGKTKLVEILAPVKEVYFLDLPRKSDYLKNVEIWVEKYNDFYLFLQKRLGRRITRKELLRACEITNRRTDVFRKIYRFRIENPGIINSFDYFIMAYASFFLEPSTWIENADNLYSEALEMSKKKDPAFNGKRILLTGAPIIFPGLKLPEILEDAGCDISADTLCSVYGRLYNPVKIDEDTETGIVRALSLKYISPSMCPCFLGMDKLIDYIIDTVREYSLDGVIYYNLRLCQISELQTGVIRHILKENKIPFLSLKTDLGKEDIGQLKTRIEAFLEMLR